VGFFIEAIFGTGFLPFGAGRKKHSLWDKADPSNFYMNGPLPSFAILAIAALQLSRTGLS